MSIGLFSCAVAAALVDLGSAASVSCRLKGSVAASGLGRTALSATGAEEIGEFGGDEDCVEVGDDSGVGNAAATEGEVREVPGAAEDNWVGEVML